MAYIGLFHRVATQVPTSIPGADALNKAASTIASSDGVLGALLILALGVIALLGWIIRGLHKDERAATVDRLEDRDKVVLALKSAADAADRGVAVSEALRMTLETRGHAIDELSHLVDKSTQDLRHQLGNLASMMDAFSRFIERDRERERERGRERDRDWTSERGRDRDERDRERDNDRGRS